MSKLIAISSGIEDSTLSPGTIPCSVLNISFVNLCNKFGAEVVIVPPQNLSIEFSSSNFDRLILTGGGDINPSLYGAEVDTKTTRISDERDKTELNLLKIAETNSIKTLAICRGHQLLNVYKGGTLHQHIADNFDTEIEHLQINEATSQHIHNINILEQTLLSEVTTDNNVGVNSIHHQVINDLGQDLKVNAMSEDNLIEGIESTSEWEAIGIQWHPENLLDDDITNELMKWLLS